MQQVNVFIETSSRFRGNVERKCGYVLSTQLRTGKETREHFGRVTGTYHQAILLTMVDALDHMTRTCDVCFYISDLYVTSRLGKITEGRIRLVGHKRKADREQRGMVQTV